MSQPSKKLKSAPEKIDKSCQAGSTWKVYQEWNGYLFIEGEIFTSVRFGRLSTFAEGGGLSSFKRIKVLRSAHFTIRLAWDEYLSFTIKEDFTYSAVFYGKAQDAKRVFDNFIENLHHFRE
jgi:hypothetical protein